MSSSILGMNLEVKTNKQTKKLTKISQLYIYWKLLFLTIP